MSRLYRIMYLLAIRAYVLGIKIASPFKEKARLMIEGRRDVLETLRQKRDPNSEYIWIHVSSLGEFEQARPLIEKIREEQLPYKICLTFFSPSGYKRRKDYPLADIVTYLPFDSSPEVGHFLDILQPSVVIYVRYEFWLRTLAAVKEREIPCYIISTIFREGQAFFRGGYGQLFREALTAFTHLFVQNKESIALLRSIGIKNCSISGDTRIDRVIKIAGEPAGLEWMERLRIEVTARGQKIIIFGSSWEQDERVYFPYLNGRPDLFPIIVPHEITETHLRYIVQKSSRPITLLSEWNPSKDPIPETLVIDRVGLLSHLYRYGDIAYIGGGFGRGIHNTPEAAVYGLPVLFGPKYHKFEEAKALIRGGGGFSISDTADLKQVVGKLCDDPTYYGNASDSASRIIKEMSGATEHVYRHIFG
ncbi:MAG: glycosyltransferase N-terminal domain-containing protein [Porphyromonas sp.]|nr:glycosyltransferase N-terminal domain-containing protein [Porphyromonas sp.]